MASELLSLSKIFIDRLFRIPDYQRGYAWSEKQLKDFWNDLETLEDDKFHYAGVLTLENAPSSAVQKWEDDEWIIKHKNFAPFYIVDGQQRLTTSLILIQSIIESIDDGAKLNFCSIEEIRKRYIFESKDDSGIARSYIFGYEKDNPSYEFLKSEIFGEHSSSGYQAEETIYTNNLSFAKSFFKTAVSKLNLEEIGNLFSKISQRVLFNIYSIGSEIDVFVAFETMNNRGKPLSTLELLKNRLIYLSTKFRDSEEERNALRKTINDSWKSVYHFLGKNKNKPLSDDVFLYVHFVVYFNKILMSENIVYRTHKRFNGGHVEFSSYLLDEYFHQKRINLGAGKNVSISDVHKYSEHLSRSVRIWFDLNNPAQSRRFSPEAVVYLERINRFGIEQVSCLLLSYFLKNESKKNHEEFLKELERYIFLTSLAWRPSHSQRSDLQSLTKDLIDGTIKAKELGKAIREKAEAIVNRPDYFPDLLDRFKQSGFYNWDNCRYFLYEYELSIKSQTKTSRDKLDWAIFGEDKNDYTSVEHIYPQAQKADNWPAFSKLPITQRRALLNSLGNLLPLSVPKNSALQNFSFSRKIENGEGFVGYKYGSYSEIEVSKEADWTPDSILKRGLKLLKFLETNWDVKFGTNEQKIEMLGLDFMQKKGIRIVPNK